jgi:hypothetical protein
MATGGNPLPCGHRGERDCPPVGAVVTAEGVEAYTAAQMHEYGEACYQKGRADRATEFYEAKPDTE